MSEIECYNGHLMLSRWGGVCQICGRRAYTMDGMTARQMAAEEEAAIREDYEHSSPEEE